MSRKSHHEWFDLVLRMRSDDVTLWFCPACHERSVENFRYSSNPLISYVVSQFLFAQRGPQTLHYIMP